MCAFRWQLSAGIYAAWRRLDVNKFITDLRIVFLRSNRISNRIGHPIQFRIESAVYIGGADDSCLHFTANI